mmetsp:Transcript_22075/g.28189  ORF Transcript_22075/g.28189 Transcript_22075/m.28189 type:complete len:127 (-) Transcript_22075:92-472(-)
MPAHQITAEETKWAIIYPVYVDAKKSRAAGRRVGVEKACDNPTANEIVDVCHALKLEAFAEPGKAYSRDYTQKGRVRVKLKTDKAPVNSEIQSKHQLLLKLGELIPRLQTRTKPTQSGKGKKNRRR